MITYQLHKMADLRFYLLAADSVPYPVHILRRRRLHHNNYQLDLRIIGSSHVISLKTASTELTECLACLTAGDMKGALMEYSLPLSSDEFTATVRDIHYTIRFNTAWLQQDEYQKRQSLLLQGKKGSLYYEFPACEGDTPLTMLKYRYQAKLIQIWTYHTYPDECGIADTYTEFRILS